MLPIRQLVPASPFQHATPSLQRLGYKSRYGGKGFDTKILKKVVALRKKDEQERMEEDAILDTYLHALGMIEAPPEG
ncbi:hypothetical protein J2W42_002736 [Rhizobium tibeticum]|uniref:DUF2312 domain-containing protein n=1 Tax=Rhizobium tibeticum TaxID=501024 RepID=UPI0027896053|nr:GapR family DNA-binding domain-containing protein [Rhizobium tibeticum]MDP9809877.1 hypothetical protein [Rhizobium tibeticum]